MITISEKLDQAIYDKGIILKNGSAGKGPACVYFHSACKKKTVLIIKKNIGEGAKTNISKAYGLGLHFFNMAGFDNVSKRKEASRRRNARAKRFELMLLMPPHKLMESYKKGCRTPEEFAFCLEITTEELWQGIETYYGIYGRDLNCGGHTITWKPFSIVENSL